ncbi:conjugal transfer ATP-binding protein [Erwinia billingiae]|uniref:conjugal transfer ATP-binding protein n=1 Tax=Erwinia billingiae TaxID=182337 RepID=UPI00320A2FE7
MASAQNQKMTAFPLKAGACNGLPAFIKTHMLRGEASARAMHRHAVHTLFNFLPGDAGHTLFTGITGSGKTVSMQEALRNVLSYRGGNNERFLD